jgi:hypothetical protein
MPPCVRGEISQKGTRQVYAPVHVSSDIASACIKTRSGREASTMRKGGEANQSTSGSNRIKLCVGEMWQCGGWVVVRNEWLAESLSLLL